MHPQQLVRDDRANGGKPSLVSSLKGFPAVNYSVEDLLYRPYNRRIHKAYGFSPVEQIITTVNIALRRQMFTLAYYTEGNVPEALIGTPSGLSHAGSMLGHWEAGAVKRAFG